MKPNAASTRFVWVLLAIAVTGCGLGKRSSALVESNLLSAKKSGGTGDCGAYGFKLNVHGVLRQNCASCHGGSGPGIGGFAKEEPGQAYADALSRMNPVNPAQSLLVARAAVPGHGGNCVNCGPAMGTQLSAAIEQWKQAFQGTAAYCASVPEDDESQTYGEQEETNSYGDPGANGGVQIHPAGLEVYRTRVQSILVSNCASCHAPDRVAATAPFGVANLHMSYLAAKPRAMLGNPSLGDLVARASTPNHGPGCSTCGPGLGGPLLAAVDDWADAEDTAEPSLTETKVKTTLPVNSTYQRLTWIFTADLENSALSDLSGTEFDVEVRMIQSNGNTYYQFRNPRIVTTNSRGAIFVNAIYLRINGTVNRLYTTFQGVDAVIPAGRGRVPQTIGAVTIPASPLLSNSSNLVIQSGGPSPVVQSIGFGFGVLQLN